MVFCFWDVCPTPFSSPATVSRIYVAWRDVCWPRELPIIGNHKLNVYLKAIRDLCGIDKPIFSHVARHTYVAGGGCESASAIGRGTNAASGGTGLF